MADITTGLLIWLTMNEGTGTSAADSSGNGRTGTLLGTPAWAAGQIGAYALDCDGVDDYCSVTHNAAFNTNHLTWAAWVNADAWGNLHTIASKQASGSPFAGLDVRNNSGLEAAIVVGSTSYAARPPSNLTTGSWQHYCVTYDGETLIFYKNAVAGTPNTTPSGNLASTSANWSFGTNGTFPSGRYFNGRIDDVRIYDRALSQADVTALFNWRRSQSVNGGLANRGLINRGLAA